MAKGNSYWAAKDAADETQRTYDEAVKYDQDKPWKIAEARKANKTAQAHLERVETTGE